MKKLVMMAALASLAACAKSPDSIAPVSMTGAYDHYACQQAVDTLAVERQNLAALEKQQKNAQAGDAIGVFLILVPISSLTGADKEGMIATTKGKVLALEQRTSRCR